MSRLSKTLAVTLTATLGVGLSSATGAVVVDNTTAGAAVVGVNRAGDTITPFDFPLFGLVATPGAGAIEPETASASAAIPGVSGNAQATVLGDVKAQSSVSDIGNADPLAVANVIGGSAAGWVATLTTDGTDPGAGIDIDLTIQLDGQLKYLDSVGDALSSLVNIGFGDIRVSEISANVSLLVALAPALGPVTEDVLQELDQFTTVFNGSATLRSPEAPAVAPVVDIVDDFSDATVTAAVCDDGDTTATCFDVLLDVVINGGTFGFGDAFELGVLLLTSGDVITGAGERAAGSLFFNTANVIASTSAQGVNIVRVNPQAVPEPDVLLLLGLSPVLLVGIRLRRRARTGDA